MSVKDIVVHVDTSPSCETRLALAADLARRFDAFLTGLFVLPSTELLELTSNDVALRLALDLVELERETAAIEKSFTLLLKHHGLKGSWLAVRGIAEVCLARRGRTADLVILGQHDPDHPTILSDPAQVVLTCGRPVLVVPYAGRFDRVARRALIAWNDSREASLAVHSALPFLAQSEAATILSVYQAGETRRSSAAGEMLEHLVRCGLNAKSETLVAGTLSVSNTLLARAADLDVDLIVMGAYGHSRLRETILGGVTRDMLRQMTVPLAMAH